MQTSRFLLDAAQGADVFGSLSYQPSILSDAYTRVALNTEEALKAAKAWTVFVNRELFGSHWHRKKLAFHRVLAMEGRPGAEALHLHFVAWTPVGQSQIDFINVLWRSWARVDWHGWNNQVEPLKDRNAAIPYIVKYGFDSILPDLSVTPTSWS
jgi:hypothetical protein